MNEFITTLRDRVQVVREQLTTAREAGQEYESDLHLARIQELLDLAARHGVDTTAWVSPADRVPAQRNRA